MTELAPVLTLCHACRSPIADAINEKIKAGIPMGRISDFTREAGFYLSRMALQRHKKLHLMTDHARQVAAAKSQMAKQQQSIKAKSGDLALLTRNIVYAGVEDGTIVPTLAEGLRAQEALDRRAEKGADRDLMLTMAQVLTGGYTPQIVEGQWVQLDAERSEDEAQFALLGSGV